MFLQTIGPELNSIGLIPQSADADNLTQNNAERVGSRRVAEATAPELRSKGMDLSVDDIESDVGVVGSKTSDVVDGYRIGHLCGARGAAGEHLLGDGEAAGHRRRAGGGSAGARQPEAANSTSSR